ncbi:MAG: hypothetical protein M1323_06605 [Candidatus Thermoplasmatota archaeon]|nr:hypothetical protein [Candidatus Thermoplasmatota archaeon]MCL6015277.1 hypothetical protein [Candidatus Thermoplasmatota archaeon]OWP54269.1 MAG: hypothetical protein B2I18_03005 [Cuniculiplasma sp. C_DKE]
MYLTNFFETVSNFTSSSSSLTGLISRSTDLIVGISAFIIAILWIPIAISFFSADEQRKYQSYSRAKNAAIGTLIYVLAISGTLFAIFKYIAVG